MTKDMEAPKVKNETNDAAEGVVHLTADIVSAYVSNNAVPISDIKLLINDVFGSLSKLSNLESGKFRAEEVADVKPAVPIKKSVSDNTIICLECGKPFKSIKRHLMANHTLTVDEYRKRWALPESYPMVAPSYAAARSKLAREMGLGRKPSQAQDEIQEPQEEQEDVA